MAVFPWISIRILLMRYGIDSFSFNPDALVQGIRNMVEAEIELRKQ